MSDYKRFVSYLYCYDNGIKKNNIGYARVETRNGQCKITIHIKLLSISNTTLDAYLFYRNDNRIIGIPLCSLPVKNSIGDCQAYISSDKIFDTNLSFSMIGGIIIPVSQNRLLGTEWDDIPIIPSLFEIEQKETTCSTMVEEVQEEKEDPCETTPSSSIPQFFNTINNYLLIDPAYINHLAPEYSGLKQNSFVLHGYDSYRHLILAKWFVEPEIAAAQASLASPASFESDPETENLNIFYQLGVPGIYSLREKAIAEKFGFLEFKTTKTTPLQYGDFGYWLVPVNF